VVPNAAPDHRGDIDLGSCTNSQGTAISGPPQFLFWDVAGSAARVPFMVFRTDARSTKHAAMAWGSKPILGTIPAGSHRLGTPTNDGRDSKPIPTHSRGTNCDHNTVQKYDMGGIARYDLGKCPLIVGRFKNLATHLCPYESGVSICLILGSEVTAARDT
jgi:hypothetical protein